MSTARVSLVARTDVADTRPSKPVPPWKLMWSPVVTWSRPASEMWPRIRRRAAGSGMSRASLTATPSFGVVDGVAVAVTQPPGGCPGLEFGAESGAPRNGTRKDCRPYSAAPTVFRSDVRSCNGEDSIPVPGLPRPCAAGGVEPHVRLRPGGVEPHPGRPPGPLAIGGQRHVVC